MKRILAYAAIGLGLVLFGQRSFAQSVDSTMGRLTRTIAHTCVAGTCTDSAPSAASDGLTIVTAGAMRITVCADSGRTLSGAGTLRIYYYSPTISLWSRNLDLGKSVTHSGERCQTFADIEVGVPRGRIAIVANGVTVSSGNLTTYLEGVTFDRR